jgi:HEAT repeat protein
MFPSSTTKRCLMERLVCVICWSEMPSEKKTCPSCGTAIDVDSPAYEKSLLKALDCASPEHKAQICRALASRGSPKALPHLVAMLDDRVVLVRVEALRALGEIGDESVIPVIQEHAASTESLAVRTAAKDALRALGTFRAADTQAR